MLLKSCLSCPFNFFLANACQCAENKASSLSNRKFSLKNLKPSKTNTNHYTVPSPRSGRSLQSSSTISVCLFNPLSCMAYCAQELPGSMHSSTPRKSSVSTWSTNPNASRAVNSQRRIPSRMVTMAANALYKRKEFLVPSSFEKNQRPNQTFQQVEMWQSDALLFAKQNGKARCGWDICVSLSLCGYWVL